MWRLRDPVLQYTETFDVHCNHEFVQCLPVSNNHWITISTVGCASGVVNVYDSLHLGLPVALKRTIANLLHTNKSAFAVQHVSSKLAEISVGCLLLQLQLRFAMGKSQRISHLIKL